MSGAAPCAAAARRWRTPRPRALLIVDAQDAAAVRIQRLVARQERGVEGHGALTAHQHAAVRRAVNSMPSIKRGSSRVESMWTTAVGTAGHVVHAAIESNFGEACQTHRALSRHLWQLHQQLGMRWHVGALHPRVCPPATGVPRCPCGSRRVVRARGAQQTCRWCSGSNWAASRTAWAAPRACICLSSQKQ